MYLVTTRTQHADTGGTNPVPSPHQGCFGCMHRHLPPTPPGLHCHCVSKHTAATVACGSIQHKGPHVNGLAAGACEERHGNPHCRLLMYKRTWGRESTPLPCSSLDYWMSMLCAPQQGWQVAAGRGLCCGLWWLWSPPDHCTPLACLFSASELSCHPHTHIPPTPH